MDDFAHYRPEASGPSRTQWSIAPSDSVDLPRVTTGLYVGVGGDVRVLPMFGDQPVTFVGAPSGQILPVRVRRVLATGTTAAGIVGLA